jgi:hypothetical protein
MNKNDILSVPDASVNLLDIATDKYYRTLTGGYSNFFNGINGIRCDEGKHNIHNNLGTITYPSTIDNVTLVLKLIDSLRYFTEKVKRDLNIAITEWNSTGRYYPDVTLSLERYMQIKGLTNKKETIQDIRKSLDVLIHSSIFIQKEHSKSNFSNINIPIFSSISYRRGIIRYEFTDIFLKLLRETTSFIIVHEILFRIPINKSTAYHLAWRLINHSRMNVNKRNEDTIPVFSLLESCPTFPREENVINNLTNQIRKPFEKSLDYLCEIGILKEWTYCYSDGTPLSDKELNATRFFYEKFKSYHVKFIMKDWDKPREVYLKYLKNKKVSKKSGRKKKL